MIGSSPAFAFVLVTVALLAACRAPARTDTSEPASAPPVPIPAAAEPKNAEPRPAPVPKRSYAVAALGDSLTDFRSHGGGYLKFLRERCPESRFDSYGKGGDMVNQMRRRMANELFDHAPVAYTHLIVFGGVNDLYSDLTAGRTVKKIAADLTAIYAAGHEHGMKVVAMTVAPWGGFKRYFTEARGETTRELNRWIVAQKPPGADFVVDTYPLLSCGDPQKLCDRFLEPFHDGLHFGPPAHQKLADALFEAVFSDCR